MKPTRGLPTSWIGSLPRERRMALSSILILFTLLGAVLLYQRYQAPAKPLQPLPAPMEVPPARATVPPSVADTSGSNGPGLDLTAAGATPGKTETASALVAAKPPESPPERLSLPLSGHPPVLKPFGSWDEAYGDFRFYPAVAYAVKPDQPVLAAARGRVTALEEDPAEGLAVVLEHSGGMSTRYTGLAQATVKPGDQVEAGSIIARTGEPGPARGRMGPHLAFAVFLNHNPVDPGLYLTD